MKTSDCQTDTHSHIAAAAFSKTPVASECNWQISWAKIAEKFNIWMSILQQHFHMELFHKLPTFPNPHSEMVTQIVPIEMRFSFVFFTSVFCNKLHYSLPVWLTVRIEMRAGAKAGWTNDRTYVTFECPNNIKIAAHSENKMRFAKLQFCGTSSSERRHTTRWTTPCAIPFIRKCGRHKSLGIQTNLFDFKAHGAFFDVFLENDNTLSHRKQMDVVCDSVCVSGKRKQTMYRTIRATQMNRFTSSQTKTERITSMLSVARAGINAIFVFVLCVECEQNTSIEHGPENDTFWAGNAQHSFATMNEYYRESRRSSKWQLCFH